jgi:hypothetical protein
VHVLGPGLDLWRNLLRIHEIAVRELAGDEASSEHY